MQHSRIKYKYFLPPASKPVALYLIQKQAMYIYLVNYKYI